MDYLDYQFEDTPFTAASADELSFWSAHFGLLMLKHIELKPRLNVLDLGSGTGFPLLELAQRLGNSCLLYGIDSWENGLERLKQKIASYRIKNVHLVEGLAEQLPFKNDFFHLITSNLSINYVTDRAKVVGECYRVLRKEGQLIITTYVQGFWNEFYRIFEATLWECGLSSFAGKLETHEAQRGTLASNRQLLTQAGFTLARMITESFEMRFLNGSAFLRHHLIKQGFLESWKQLIPVTAYTNFFSSLENNLNRYAEQRGELRLTVPMVYLEGVK